MVASDTADVPFGTGAEEEEVEELHEGFKHDVHWADLDFLVSVHDLANVVLLDFRAVT